MRHGRRLSALWSEIANENNEKHKGDLNWIDRSDRCVIIASELKRKCKYWRDVIQKRNRFCAWKMQPQNGSCEMLLKFYARLLWHLFQTHTQKMFGELRFVAFTWNHNNNSRVTATVEASTATATTTKSTMDPLPTSVMFLILYSIYIYSVHTFVQMC